MIDLLEQLIDEYMGKDAEFIDLRYENNHFNNINIVNGKTRNIISAIDSGIGIRVFINGAWGFSSTNKLDKNSIKNTMDSAYKIAKIIEKKAKLKFKLNDQPAHKKKVSYPQKKKLKDISADEKLELALYLDKQARDFDNRIINSNTIYLDFVGEQILLNSFGTQLETTINFVRIVSVNYAFEAGVRQRGFESLGGTAGFELMDSDRAQNLGSLASEKAIRLLTAVPAKAGKVNIIMDPSLTGVFVHEAFGHASEADAVLARESILSDKIGTQVGLETVSILDDPTLKGNFGYYPFDSEGSPSKKKFIVEKGILKNFLHSIETASRLDMQPNGNCRAQNYQSIPIVRMSNTYFEPGTLTLEELFEEVRNGLFLEGWQYGYTDPTEGSFTFKCNQAYKIENGEKRELLRDASLSGMTLEVLNHVMGIGRTLEFADGYCGKEAQSVPVSDGGPPVAIKDVIIGGLE